ncbi:FAD-dependent oxidoreductase [Candidatus Micrarchaeota archaeon]|nr:FAD-dependent oxidoreductase [Candidatus Micrarchaeota archaeon]
MTGNYPSLELNMRASEPGADKTAEIDADGIYYRQLNENIRRLALEGKRRIILKGVRGQRYLGAGLSFTDLYLQVQGIPGEDLGFNLNGPTIEVFGHSQNAVANTMDNGKIIVHGLGGDALAYGMRGGELFVRDDVGYRVGIHMKEYRRKVPVLVIGGTSGDYLGEYMAGGLIILLNKDNAKEFVAGNSDKTLATGIHGGEIYLFGYEPPAYLLGIGALLTPVTRDDLNKIKPYVREFARCFQIEAVPLLKRELFKIVPAGKRPFARFYYPSYPVDTGLKPVHVEKCSPCEASCPAGIPTGRFLRLLRLGEAEKAIRLLDEYTPLRYSCCGFICPHICMENCTRRQVDFPVRSEELARYYKNDLTVEMEEAKSERIAVIGAGPAGLSAAYQLARRGYPVTVFDESHRPGGKLYQVVSRIRLPLESLEHDLQKFASLGVKFVLNTSVNKGMMENILKEYEHVVVSVGAHQPLLPPVKGKKYLRAGLDFLKDYNLGRFTGSYLNLNPQSDVVVVGGGDAAVDGIEAFMALGAAPDRITVIDIKRPSAKGEERSRLEAEGIRFRYPLFLQEVNKEGLIVKDALGQEQFLPAALVLVFINERPQMAFLPEEVLAGLDQRGFYSREDEVSFRSAHPRISIAGDVQGQGLVTTNIGRGRKCALEIDALLRGREYVPEKKDPLESVFLQPQKASPAGEEELSIEEEYDRCLHCGICVQCDRCVEACPRGALTRDGETFNVDLFLCGGCGTCAATCLGGVIRMVPR